MLNLSSAVNELNQEIREEGRGGKGRTERLKKGVEGRNVGNVDGKERGGDKGNVACCTLGVE